MTASASPEFGRHMDGSSCFSLLLYAQGLSSWTLAFSAYLEDPVYLLNPWQAVVRCPKPHVKLNGFCVPSVSSVGLIHSPLFSSAV